MPTKSYAHIQLLVLVMSFSQPLNNHILLTERISLMIRGGYVGRNPRTGDLQKHLQNGYERIQKGDLKAFRFESVKSTAQSMVTDWLFWIRKNDVINQNSFSLSSSYLSP